VFGLVGQLIRRVELTTMGGGGRRNQVGCWGSNTDALKEPLSYFDASPMAAPPKTINVPAPATVQHASHAYPSASKVSANLTKTKPITIKKKPHIAIPRLPGAEHQESAQPACGLPEARARMWTSASRRYCVPAVPLRLSG